MKTLVFSDSHGRISPMRSAILAERPRQIIHVGDNEADADVLRQEFPDISVAGVPGNCDLYWGRDRYKLIELAGHRLFLTHGHHYGVKLGLESLICSGSASGADIVLFGHTHTPHAERVNGVLILNPGSVGPGSRTYAVLTFEGGKVEYEIRDA